MGERSGATRNSLNFGGASSLGMVICAEGSGIAGAGSFPALAGRLWPGRLDIGEVDLEVSETGEEAVTMDEEGVGADGSGAVAALDLDKSVCEVGFNASAPGSHPQERHTVARSKSVRRHEWFSWMGNFLFDE